MRRSRPTDKSTGQSPPPLPRTPHSSHTASVARSGSPWGDQAHKPRDPGPLGCQQPSEKAPQGSPAVREHLVTREPPRGVYFLIVETIGNASQSSELCSTGGVRCRRGCGRAARTGASGEQHGPGSPCSRGRPTDRRRIRARSARLVLAYASIAKNKCSAF